MPTQWDQFEAVDEPQSSVRWDDFEPVESTPLERESAPPPIPLSFSRAPITGEIPEVGGGIPPQLTDADIAEAQKQSKLGEEIAGTMAEGEATSRAARIFEPNLPRNLLAPTTEEFLSDAERFRASMPAELRPWQQSPFRPPTTAAELSPETRESLAAGQAASGTLADLSSADQALLLGAAAASGGVPGTAGRILGAAVPATFGVEGVKSIYEGGKTLLSPDATPEERGQAKFQIGMGATMLPGLGALVKRPAIPPQFIETMRRVDAVVPDALPRTKEAAIKKVANNAANIEVEAKVEPITKGETNGQKMQSKEVQEDARQGSASVPEGGSPPEVTPPGEAPPAPAPAEATIASRLEAADKMTRAELIAHEGEFGGGATAVMHEVGSKAKTAEDVAALKQAALESDRKSSALMDAGDFDGAGAQSGKQLAEAYEFATGVKVDGTPKWTAFEKAYPGYKPPVPDAQYVKAKGGADLTKGGNKITPETQPERIVVQAEQDVGGGETMPGYVTIQSKGNAQSGPVEAWRAAGHEIPDTTGLPSGTYTVAELKARAKPSVAYEAFRLLDEATEKGDTVKAHALKRVIEGRPEVEREAAIDARLKESDARTELAKANAKTIPSATEATTPAAPNQTSIQARRAPVVEPGVGAVPENVSGAGAEAVRPNAQPVSEALAEVGPGMGGALKAEPPDARAQLAQLTDSIATLAAEGKAQPAKAFSLGETLSKAKDSATAALDGLKAAGSYMKLKLEGKPTATEYKGVLGDRHLALSESSVNARKWVQNVKKAVPDPKVREAISNWVDSGGDPALLAKAAGETKPQYKAGYERAQKLTPEEKVVAENLKNYFDSRLQEAIDAGVLEDGIENYIHRIYEQDSPWKKGVIQELRSGLFTGKPALAKQRVFEYDFEAEKAGKKPIKDFAKRVVAYDLALNKAIADRAAVKGMMEIRMGDGRPMIDVGGGGKVIENAAGEPQATIINRSAKKIDPNDAKANRGDYKPFDHPALRKWKWATEDTAGKPVFVQGDVLIHPEAIGDINKLLGRSAIRRNPVGRAALNVSSTIKQTMLDLSGFHPVQIAVHGTEHRTFAPVKEIDFTNPDVRGLIRGGAAVGETSGHAAFSEGLSGGSGSLTRHIPWAGERLQAYNSWLFEDYIPRLKVAMGLHALERNRSRFKDLSPDQQYELTANQMNAAFGEQNYTMLGRSKTTQDALRLVLLAPDFLEARSRFVAQAFTKYGAEQRQALLLGAATMYITARLINKMLDDEYHFEPKNAFNVVYGGKSYGLRTVQGDLIHAVTEPGKFINHRLNPVFGKPALEFVTGRDYFGRKRTVGEQLKDFAKTPVPIGVRGAFENQEQTLFESFLNSFGLVTKRDSAASDVSKLAADWRKENKISTGPGEFIYDADKDPFRDIKLAAERGDEAGVRSEVAKAMNAGLKRSRILEHFKLSATHYFSGSAANEKKFIASLTEDQKKIYHDAVAERKRIRETVRRAGFPP